MKIPLTNHLKPVAPNLYRHSDNLTYYAVKKINGRKVRHPLNTSDRKTADRKLVQWLGELQMNTPGASATSDTTVVAVADGVCCRSGWHAQVHASHGAGNHEKDAVHF
ncbi:MAG: hypothetical protein ABIZ56_08760 [Chthoniobacteraceae bacterium]